MADHNTCLPLTPESVHKAYNIIQSNIHRTPLLTCQTLDRIASTPVAEEKNSPKFNLYFKCENTQKIGAFKARGAFHAVKHLIEEVGLEILQKRGVVTHSSGNHAQALALAAHTFQIPAYIVMPTISTPSKIDGTRAYTDHVIFSGSTSDEREAKVAEVMRETGSILVPPYDHPDIILGQGTTGLEIAQQFQVMKNAELRGSGAACSHAHESTVDRLDAIPEHHLDAVITPLGGGGLTSGVSTFFSNTNTLVFAAEPSFEGADDARRGLAVGKRIDSVKTLTIADGLRTPLSELTFGIIQKQVKQVFAVTEVQIKKAMKLVMERMKVVVEPSACVGLAVILFNDDFRKLAFEKQQMSGGGAWDMAVVFSGGNTTMEAINILFAPGWDNEEADDAESRAAAKVGIDGEKHAENVAG